MLVNLKEVLRDAVQNNYAVGSFNTPNLETLRAVIAAAEELDSPVIINHAEGHESTVAIEVVAPLMLEYARNARVPVCVHIDHGHSKPFVMKAIRLGFTSIMYDCSHLPLEENIRELKSFIEMVRPLGISVEAELGEMPNNMPTEIPGQEKSDLSDLSVYYTKPEEAARLCHETGVEALTISFGTIHGLYESEPVLDIPLLREIRGKIQNESVLVMHGGSGVDPGQIRDAVKNGIRKINYFTAMDTAPAAKLLEILQRAAAENRPVNYSNLVNEATEILKLKCMEAIRSFQ